VARAGARRVRRGPREGVLRRRQGQRAARLPLLPRQLALQGSRPPLSLLRSGFALAWSGCGSRGELCSSGNCMRVALRCDLGRSRPDHPVLVIVLCVLLAAESWRI